MNKIKQVSLFFRILFQLIFIALPLIHLIAWIKAPVPISFFNGFIVIDMIPHLVPILHPLSSFTKILGFAICMIPTGIELLVLYYLIRLFKQYEEGEIFSSTNVNYIRSAGYSLLIGQMINPLYDGLISTVLSWNNPHGHRMAVFTVDGTNVGIILTALLVILISWIMAEAYKLREEQQLTI